MFEVVETLCIQLINCLPVWIPFILVMNICSSLLWGKGND